LHSHALLFSAFMICCPAGDSGVWVAGQGEGTRVVFPEVPGYTLTTEATVYEPSNLWDFIDGAADLFVSYGFVDLHIAYYDSGDGVEIRAEVYRHDTPEDAFGMYSQERLPRNSYLDIGTQGYAEEGMINFLSGRYYVKLSSNRVGKSVGEGLFVIAKRIEAVLGQRTSWPVVLALLPVEGRVRNSEQYIAESYLGYTFLRGAYTAQYGGGEPFEIFVILGESDTAVAGMVAALADVNHITFSAGNDRIIRDVHQGEIALVLGGRYLGGVIRCKDVSERSKYVKILQSSFR
jgi:hypothetical protein